MKGRFEVRDLRSGALLGDRIGAARGFASRLCGLLGRTGLSPGEGLLLEGCGGVHTCFMRFPIDLCFLDRDARVLRTVEGLPPWRASACPGAAHVLELPAGALRGHGVAAGDVLEIRPCA